ncbi:MAG: dihydrodipicolinate synthase family protein [Gammaproteobacteria bacterium]|nr:dihydrodipicolinate synthase family protein [Gammaproteobacteria bacterium]
MAREEMADGQTRENLHGIWIALTTPFTADNRIDTGVVRENVRRCHAAGLHGAYTTDSDGEFYAIELDDFRTLVEAFGDECQRVGMPSQAGVTWLNTQGTVDRLRIAADSGVMGAHVGHPVFMPMTPASFDRFWEDVSDAVPDDFGLIQYNTPRQPHVLGGAEYRALAEKFPKLVGAKYVQ